MKIANRLRVTLVLVGLVVLPLPGGLQVMAAPAPQSAEQSSAKQKTVQFRIAGMTCAACAKGLEASFRNLILNQRCDPVAAASIHPRSVRRSASR